MVFTFQCLALVVVTWDMCSELELFRDSCCKTWSEILFIADLFVFIQEISSFVTLEMSVYCDEAG